MIGAMLKHAEGQIAKHRTNVLIYMDSGCWCWRTHRYT